MTITPTFSVTQDSSSVFVKIHVPYIRVVGATEFYISVTEFNFCCKPYLLHLSLPYNVLDEEGNCGDYEEDVLKTHTVRRLVEEVGATNTSDQKPFESSPILPQHNKRKASALYDPNDNHGTLCVTLPKEIPGQFFPDLDLISKLMMKKCRGGVNLINATTRNGRPGIMVMDENNADEECLAPEEELNRVIETTATDSSCEPTSLSNLLGGAHSYYGFLQLYHGVFEGLKEEIIQARDGMLELPYQPECITETVEERRQQRLQMEDEKFNVERFFKDSDIDVGEDDMVYLQAVEMVPHWKGHHVSNAVVATDQIDGVLEQMSCLSMNASNSNIDDDRQRGEGSDYFTTQERDTLTKIGLLQRNKNMTRKRKLHENYSGISLVDHQGLMLGLLDLLFAYCYDHRVTGGEPSCESAWTITVLSPMLSWLESYQQEAGAEAATEPIQVICYSIRRSFIYPYIRNFKFSSKLIVEDVIRILLGGKRTVLRCLLQMRSILEHTTSETYYYLLNTIFVDDYCTWVQVLSGDDLKTFADQVSEDIELAQSRGWAAERDMFIRLNVENMKDFLFNSDDNSSASYSSSESKSESESTTSAESDADKIESTPRTT